LKFTASGKMAITGGRGETKVDDRSEELSGGRDEYSVAGVSSWQGRKRASTVIKFKVMTIEHVLKLYM